MIRQSVRSFVFGLLGLVPILGAPMAVLAVRTASRAALGSSGQWNPARAYWIAGFLMGGTGLLLTLACLGLVVYRLVT